MGSPLENAFASVDRSYFAAKSASSSRPAAVLGDDLGGMNRSSSLCRAAEQLARGNEGWQFVAARAIANRVAAQNLCVGRVTTARVGRKLIVPSHLKSIGDRIEPLPDHPLLQAIAEPNPIHTQWALLHVSVVSLSLTGVCYWWCTPGETGIDLWYIPASWLTPKDRYQSGWKLRVPGNAAEERDIPGEEIFACSLPSAANPFEHSSPLQAQAIAVETDAAIQRAQHESFSMGVFPKVAFRVGGEADPISGKTITPTLTPEQRVELIDSIKRLYSGRHNRNNPVILDAMIQGVEKLSLSSQEMDYLQSSQLVKDRVFSSFGVSPFTVGATQDGNRAQAVVAEQTFCTNVINPLCEALSQSLTRFVNKKFALPGEKLVAWIEPASPNDRELTLQEWQVARQNGDVTVNEYRVNILNLPPIAGGDVRLDNLGNPIGER